MTRLRRLRGIGKDEHFPWPHLDRDHWPGRELWWVWCHPTLSLVGFATTVYEVVQAVTQ